MSFDPEALLYKYTVTQNNDVLFVDTRILEELDNRDHIIISLAFFSETEENPNNTVEQDHDAADQDDMPEPGPSTGCMFNTTSFALSIILQSVSLHFRHGSFQEYSLLVWAEES